jgi:hypothetical protein
VLDAEGRAGGAEVPAGPEDAAGPDAGPEDVLPASACASAGGTVDASTNDRTANQRNSFI